MAESAANLQSYYGTGWHTYGFEIIRALGHRTGAVTPIAAVTPDFIGQEYFDTVTGVFYRAVGTANTDWTAIGDPGLTAAELSVLDGVTPGTVAASKAVVTDSNSQVSLVSIASGGSLAVSSGGTLGFGVSAQAPLKASSALSATLSLFATTGASYVAQTSATVSGVFGFTSVNAVALINALTEIRAVLSNYGLSKGGA